MVTDEGQIGSEAPTAFPGAAGIKKKTRRRYIIIVVDSVGVSNERRQCALNPFGKHCRRQCVPGVIPREGQRDEHHSAK